MPELPEVEVLRRSLEPHVVGCQIERVAVHDSRLRERVDPSLSRRLSGRSIERLRRRAKYLLVDLSGGSTLVVHLGMSGRFSLAPADSPLEPYEHVSIHLDSGRRLCFRDPRRFGLILALPTATLRRDRRFRDLGMEPLADDFSGSRLRSAAAGRRASVKSFLMNSRLVVGLGNIYASEALFEAGIHPRRSVARIAAPRWDGLCESVRAVLGRAIAQGGTTLNDFRDAHGREGHFQASLAVYGRSGRACLRCGHDIRRIVQAVKESMI